MCNLKDLTVDCGSRNSPGTEIDLYYTCSCELNGWPATKAANGSALPGATKVLDEAFDFSTAPVGSGYWRKARILVDTGKVTDALEGEVGGQGFVSSFEFFIVGSNAEQLEFADNMVSTSGFLVTMIRDNNGNMRVLGNDRRPAYVETLELTTGMTTADRRGGAYKISARMSETAPIYDDVAYGIDLTPNV